MAKERDDDGLTWFQWASMLFSFENCEECGKGVRNHVEGKGPFGEWHAWCKEA